MLSQTDIDRQYDNLIKQVKGLTSGTSYHCWGRWLFRWIPEYGRDRVHDNVILYVQNTTNKILWNSAIFSADNSTSHVYENY